MAIATVENTATQIVQNKKAIIPKSLETTNSSTTKIDSPIKMTIFKWFLEPQFYLIASVYLATRLFINISVSFISLYMQHTLKMESIYVALIPLVMYVTGFIISILLKLLTNRIGFKLAYALSCLMGICK